MTDEAPYASKSQVDRILLTNGGLICELARFSWQF
jgi:hypothetical protein